jgi:hypothetical protein
VRSSQAIFWPPWQVPMPFDTHSNDLLLGPSPLENDRAQHVLEPTAQYWSLPLWSSPQKIPGLDHPGAASTPPSFVPPLVPELPLEPLDPDEPLEPLDPDEPLVPELPLVPDEPLEPEVPDVPLLPGVGSVGKADSPFVGWLNRSCVSAPLHAATELTRVNSPETTNTPAVREIMKPEL